MSVQEVVEILRVRSGQVGSGWVGSESVLNLAGRVMLTQPDPRAVPRPVYIYIYRCCHEVSRTSGLECI